MKYTAINIGPIIKTLGMARKPRELWAASYLFSYLMKCIIKALPNKYDIISPALFGENEHNGIGLYPDRVFVKGEIAFEMVKNALNAFADELELDSDYFNVMMATEEYSNDSAAIKGLNAQLDRMELFNVAVSKKASECVRKIISTKYDSKLFVDAFETIDFPIETLGEIAASELKNEPSWQQFVSNVKSEDKVVAEKPFDKFPKDKLKSYHKYICVVQADGDNVGKTVSHSSLSDGKVNEISKELLEFGKKATATIKLYGGLPIYAGGDDLLFIAPVVGIDHTNIFQLLDKLNDNAFAGVKRIVDECGLKTEDEKEVDIHASLSFGVSITYYKYPLYEALESARNLLFGNAKYVNGKNAVVVDWRKHSGGAFAIQFSKSKKALKDAFEKMIAASAADESVVSAVAHKIRENEGLLKLWLDSGNFEKRNSNFFQKYLEHNPNKNNKSDSDVYKDAALVLLNKLCEVNDMDSKIITENMYSMLRLAKFMNGEEVRDE